MRRRWAGEAILGTLLLAVLAGIMLPRLWERSLVVRVVPLAPIPWQVVVDPRTRRAFVLTAERTTNTVRVLDTATGALLHTVVIGGSPLYDSVELTYGAVPLSVVDETTQRVFVANQGLDGQGTISILDARTGALLHTDIVGLWERQTGVIGVDEHSQRVFVAGQGMDGQGHVSMLDARSGAVLRTLVLGLDPAALAVDAATQQVFVIGTRGVTVLDADTGRPVRTMDLAATGGRVVVAAGAARVFVSDSRQGAVHLLDARTGRLLRTVALSHGVGVMALDERTNHVYVAAATSGSISVLDARSGALVRTLGVGLAPTAVAVDPHTDQVLVSALGQQDAAGHVTGFGTVSVLDGRALTVQQTIGVGVAPADLAVDEQEGHALVVNSLYNTSDCSLAVVRPAEAWWAPEVRALTQWLPWLPLPAPASPAGPTTGSVSLLAGV